jgi:hypothetical protein
MGTKGLLVFKWNGVNYYFDNNMDGGVGAMGMILVTILKLTDTSNWGYLLEDESRWTIRKHITNYSNTFPYKNTTIEILDKFDVFGETPNCDCTDSDCPSNHDTTTTTTTNQDNDKPFDIQYYYQVTYSGTDTTNVTIKWHYSDLICEPYNKAIVECLIEKFCPTFDKLMFLGKNTIQQVSDIYASWIYTIDLDTSMFSVKCEYTEPPFVTWELNSIPENWLTVLSTSIDAYKAERKKKI